LDSKHFGFLDPNLDPQKYVDPWIQIQVANYQPKPVKKKYASKTLISPEGK